MEAFGSVDRSTLPGARLGLVYAGAHLRAARHAGTFICPLTGQELPCPKCCPLSNQSRVRPDGSTRPAAGVGLAADLRPRSPARVIRSVARHSEGGDAHSH